ncbi:MAG TPA: AAA family ATPase [Acidimicrobiales bacterium]|nr:AAA family ATPase [Acidimicrobiales bacterium]
MTVGTTGCGEDVPSNLCVAGPKRGLVGRTAELAVVHGLLVEAVAGQGRVALIEGEAGIGKTAVVDELVQMARASGARVAPGEADELDARRPFGILAKALGITASAADPALAALAGMLAKSEPAEDRQAGVTHSELTEYRVGEAILDLVDALSTDVPLVLVVENLHWADPSSLGCLQRLIPTVAGRPILLLLTARPLVRRPDLLRLLEGPIAVAHVHLAPLQNEAVASLAQQLLQAAPGPTLALELERAGGNPLFVTELLRVLEARGLLSRLGSGQVEVEHVSPSTSLSMTILHRISLLPAEALDLLRLGAVLGPSFSAGELSVLSAKRGVELMGPVEQALSAGVLRERDDQLAFRHELIYQTLYEDIPLSLRAAFHREMGLHLAEQGAPAGRVAEHLARGAEAGDREAARWLHRAGRDELAASPPLAVSHLRQAAELSGVTDRPLVEADLALALIWSGRNVEGETLARDLATRRDDPVVLDRLSHAIATSLLMRGHAAEARDFERIARTSGALDRSSELMARCVEAMSALFSGDREAAEGLARSALTAGHQSDDTMAAGTASVVLSFVDSSYGRLTSALAHATEAVRLAAASPMTEVNMGTPHVALAAVLTELDRLGEAKAYLREGRRRGEQMGSRITVAFYDLSLVGNEYLAGSWDDALAEAATGLAEAEESGAGWCIDPLALRATIEVQRGQLDLAQADLAEVDALTQAGQAAAHIDWIYPANALLHEANGDTAGALGILHDMWDIADSFTLPLVYVQVSHYVARLSLACGDDPGARRAAEAVRELASANPGVERFDVIASWCEQLARLDAEGLAEVATRMAGAPRPLERALAHEDAATALALADRQDDAHGHAEAAIAGYEQLQASWQLDRARARLRNAGLRLGARRPRRRATAGWDALSATERRVAGLVGEGLSNVEIAGRLFLSRRTVETHVAHILAKLPCPSKRDLARLAARRSAGAQPGGATEDLL